MNTIYNLIYLCVGGAGRAVGHEGGARGARVAPPGGATAAPAVRAAVLLVPARRHQSRLVNVSSPFKLYIHLGVTLIQLPVVKYI